MCCFVVVFIFGFRTGPVSGTSITVEDSTGKKVPLDLPVKRIVALNSDVLEVLRTLNAQELVVGVFSELVREREFWGGLADLPGVGSWHDPDMEAIAALKPDLVVSYRWNPGRILERKMSLMGIQVLRLDLYKIDKLEREVRVLGQLLDREKDAERFCGWHRRYVEMIRGKIPGEPDDRPLVYIESYSDYHTAGPGSGGHEMCVMAGGKNIAADLSVTYPRVTPEWVVSRNPDLIIKAVSYGNGYGAKNSDPFNRRRDAVMARPAWRHIKAVSTGKVYAMDSGIWTGPRAIIGIACMARWLYPEIFRSIDPETLHKDYLETFQGMEYKGKFVSDPLWSGGE